MTQVSIFSLSHGLLTEPQHWDRTTGQLMHTVLQFLHPVTQRCKCQTTEPARRVVVPLPSFLCTANRPQGRWLGFCVILASPEASACVFSSHEAPKSAINNNNPASNSRLRGVNKDQCGPRGSPRPRRILTRSCGMWATRSKLPSLAILINDTALNSKRR